jgi:hypothetical protein
MSLTDLTTASDSRSTKGRCPVFRLRLNGEEFNVTVQSANLSMVEGDHESGTLTCTTSVYSTTETFIDSTISFYFGSAPRTELFCGYITHVSVTQAGVGNLTFTIDVLGSTKLMQNVSPRFWRNRSIPSLVKTLAFLNGLGFAGHDHPYLWPSFAQTSDSDWAVATAAADRLGWSVFTRYGIVMCYDPIKLFRDNGSYATLMSSQDQDFKPGDARRLIEFNPAEQSEVDPTNQGPEVAYFGDDQRVTVAKADGDYKQYRFMTSYVVKSDEEAKLYVNSANSRMTQWLQFATARIWGDADIYPGMCIDVITTNTALNQGNKFDGRWLVRSAIHQMDTSQYQTNLLLSRPDNVTQVSSLPYAPFWTGQQQVMSASSFDSLGPGSTKVGLARPILYIQDGAWMSSWTDLRVRDVM